MLSLPKHEPLVGLLLYSVQRKAVLPLAVWEKFAVTGDEHFRTKARIHLLELPHRGDGSMIFVFQHPLFDKSLSMLVDPIPWSVSGLLGGVVVANP